MSKGDTRVQHYWVYIFIIASADRTGQYNTTRRDETRRDETRRDETRRDETTLGLGYLVVLERVAEAKISKRAICGKENFARERGEPFFYSIFFTPQRYDAQPPKGNRKPTNRPAISEWNGTDAGNYFEFVVYSLLGDKLKKTVRRLLSRRADSSSGNPPDGNVQATLSRPTEKTNLSPKRE